MPGFLVQVCTNFLRKPQFRSHSQGLGDTGPEVTGKDGSWCIPWPNPEGQPDAARRGKISSRLLRSHSWAPAMLSHGFQARPVPLFLFSLSLYPQVISGDPFEQGQDGFPIENVGNDGGEMRMEIRWRMSGMVSLLGHPRRWLAGISQKQR
jgi:hypothetical protein